MAENKIKVASRKSKLAVIQTKHVIKLLQDCNAEKEFEMVTMHTIGDKILDQPLPEIGEKSLFTKELETAIINGEISFVVHSLKDLPTTLPDNMVIAAACKRVDPRDIAVFHSKHKGKCLSSLPQGSVIGTSSLRRSAQLANKYPHLVAKDIRGNLNTRLDKLDKGDIYDGLLLAKAGVERMGWEDRISQCFNKEEMLYCVGQGSLAVECREDDDETIALLEPLSHRKTTLCVIAERSFLKYLNGGCSAPVGVSSNIVVDKDGEEVLTLTGGVWSLDGKQALLEEQSCRFQNADGDFEPPSKTAHMSRKVFCGMLPGSASVEDCSIAQQLGEDLASLLIKSGASKIVETARQIKDDKILKKASV